MISLHLNLTDELHRSLKKKAGENYTTLHETAIELLQRQLVEDAKRHYR